MAYEAGGYADKMGNRYERRWVIKKYLEVIAEQIRSVKHEPAGAEGEGIDLWIEDHDDHRQCQQCKGELGNKSEWTMSDLNEKKILSTMKDQLLRDENATFLLVSSVPATMFKDLTRSARDSAGNPASFYNDQVLMRSKDHRTAFSALMRHLSLVEADDHDRATAYDLLRRSDHHHFLDDQETWRDLRLFAGLLFSGDPENVLSALSTFADNHLRKTIYADHLLPYLQSQGVSPKDLSHDGRLLPCIEELRRQFDDSLKHHLAGGSIIHRHEADLVIQAIDDGEDRVIVLEGDAGMGKSGVILEVTSQLRERQIPYLPLRLDRQIPEASARQFGKKLDLPDSPVACLRAVAGRRTGVLILDQLDAMRWTSSHAESALPICEEIVRQLMAATNLRVIVTCRSFDLNNDPQLRHWRKKSSRPTVKVGPLSESAVAGFVDARGGAYAALTNREKKLLSSIQNLSMWCEIVATAGEPRFRTSTELMTKFWENRRRELAKRKVDHGETERVLGSLIEYMDQHSQLSVPERHVEASEPAISELKSLHIIQFQNRCFSFCHQSYFDYLLAGRLLKQFDESSGSVVDWLGETSRQSLFRREQLRLILSLIYDENVDRFVDSINQLLTSDHVRFHLKQLALEVVGQTKNPESNVVDFAAFVLRNSPYWKHFIDQLVRSDPEWFAALHDRGIWRDWLASNNDERVNFAVYVLINAASTNGERVARLLEPYVDREDSWQQRILRIFPRQSKEESPSLFELRMMLARRGVVDAWFDWSDCAAFDPQRFINLLVAHLEHYTRKIVAAKSPDEEPEVFESFSRRTKDDVIADVGCQNAQVVIDKVVPAVEQYLQARRRKGRGYGWYALRRRTALPKIIVSLIESAGRSLIQQKPSEFFEFVHTLPDNASRTIQRVAAASMLAGSPNTSDRAMRWLIADPRRLRLGKANMLTRWEPARRLIRRFSKTCSDEVFAELENFLMSYRDPEVKEDRQCRAMATKEGRFGMQAPSLFGESQFRLLPALPRSRKSSNTIAFEGVAYRKFIGWFNLLKKLSRHAKGGFVRSSIKQQNLCKLTDAGWLQLIGRHHPYDENPRPRRRIAGLHKNKDGAITESSVKMFSRDLEFVTQRQPQRFARLALRIPTDAPAAYLSRLVSGLQTEDPPGDLTDDEKRAWRAATDEQVVAVLQHVLPDMNGSDRAIAFCRLVRHRSTIRWPAHILDKVAEIAVSHPEPRPNEFVILGERNASHLENNSINVARGVAAWSIYGLLQNNDDLLPCFETAIERLVADPHPAVRVAAIAVCMAVLRIDRDRAVDWFVKACDYENDLILACRSATRIVSVASRTHLEQTLPIIHRMLKSKISEIERGGATHAAARWIVQGELQCELEACLDGPQQKRLGVAVAARELVHDERFGDRCRELLARLFRDDDTTVRQECNKMFYRDVLNNFVSNPEFLINYSTTPAFRADPGALLHDLIYFTGSLIPLKDIIFEFCQVVSEGGSEDTRHITPLLLRLYEQANAPSHIDTQQRCLDMFDLMLEKRIDAAVRLLRELDG